MSSFRPTCNRASTRCSCESASPIPSRSPRTASCTAARSADGGEVAIQDAATVEIADRRAFGRSGVAKRVARRGDADARPARSRDARGGGARSDVVVSIAAHRRRCCGRVPSHTAARPRFEPNLRAAERAGSQDNIPDFDTAAREEIDERWSPLGIGRLRVTQTNAAIVVRHDASLSPQAYRLTVNDGRATIVSGDSAGAFYGAMTLAQLPQREGSGSGRCRA